MGMGAALVMAAVAAASTAVSVAQQNKIAKQQEEAQRKALEQQQKAQQEQLELQKKSQARMQAAQEQAANRANAEIANAAGAVNNTPSKTNTANLTGGLGVPTSDLALGGGAGLGDLGSLTTLIDKDIL